MHRRRLVMVAVLLAAGTWPGTAAIASGGGHDTGGVTAPPEPYDHGEGQSGQRPESFSFDLSGSQVPDGGDPHGRARALLHLDPDRELVCLRTGWRDLDGEVTAIHVHHAPAGQNGPHHIEILNDESLAGEENHVEFCVKVTGDGAEPGQHQAHAAGSESEPGDRIQQIIDNPADFYLNVHTSAHPKGAIRGQVAD